MTVIATVNHVTDAMTVTRDRDSRQSCYGDVSRAAVVGLSRQDSQLGGSDTKCRLGLGGSDTESRGVTVTVEDY